MLVKILRILLCSFLIYSILQWYRNAAFILHYTVSQKLPKIQIFRRYSADVEETANRLHFKCTDFIYTCDCVY